MNSDPPYDPVREVVDQLQGKRPRSVEDWELMLRLEELTRGGSYDEEVLAAADFYLLRNAEDTRGRRRRALLAAVRTAVLTRPPDDAVLRASDVWVLSEAQGGRPDLDLEAACCARKVLSRGRPAADDPRYAFFADAASRVVRDYGYGRFSTRPSRGRIVVEAALALFLCRNRGSDGSAFRCVAGLDGRTIREVAEQVAFAL